MQRWTKEKALKQTKCGRKGDMQEQGDMHSKRIHVCTSIVYVRTSVHALHTHKGELHGATETIRFHGNRRVWEVLASLHAAMVVRLMVVAMNPYFLSFIFWVVFIYRGERV